MRGDDVDEHARVERSEVEDRSFNGGGGKGRQGEPDSAYGQNERWFSFFSES